MAICKLYDFKYINYACMPFVKACLRHTKLHAMCHKWRLIYMVTQIHTQLKEDEDLSVCDSSEPNLNNFWGKWRQKPQRTMLRHCYQIQKKYTVFNVQCISMLQQRYKQSESLPNHFLGISLKKKGVLSILDTLLKT